MWGSCFFCCTSSLLRLPPSSSSLTQIISHTTSLTQHLSHNISHTTSLTTTSHTQHHSHNISHTTSLKQHLTHNITHTTSHNISHTTSLTQHLSQQHLTHNITHTTSHTQHLAHITHTTSPTTQHLTRSICVLCAALACQGVGCTPWRRLGTGALPAAFACCVCLPRGRMYALASAGHRRSAGGLCVRRAALAACQGVRCTPWRRLGTGALPAAFASCARRLLLAKGSMYALASAGHRRSAGGLCVLRAVLACQGVGRTPWCRLGTGALPVAFACCVRHLLATGVGCTSAGHRRSAGRICAPCAALAACQGVGCTLASAGHRRSAGGVCVLCAALDVRPGVGWAPALSFCVDARPGVGWAPALCRQHLRAVCGACCLPAGVGCAPWCRLGTGALPENLRAVCGACCVFFHECGRRVGGVPRSS